MRTTTNRHAITSMLASVVLTALLASPATAETTCPGFLARVTTTSLDGTNKTTDTGNWENVPDALVRFRQGGSRPSCVLVTFSADTSTTAGAKMFLRLLLDGEPAASAPPEVALVTDDPTHEFRTAPFFIAVVEPGEHRVRVQFRSFEGEVTLSSGSVIVQSVR